MPVFNGQLTGQAQQPDGSFVVVPPQFMMQQRGPVVQVTVGVADLIAAQLSQQGLAVPTPVAGWALIDTGASGTCIDDAVARQLQLPVIDVVQMTSASHAATQQNVYPSVIEIAGANIRINVPRSMGALLNV